MGMSAVQGHYHTKFLVSWWANPDNLFFAMNVGCLINQKSLAFAYVPPSYSEPGTLFDITLLGIRRQATVMKEAVYDPNNERLRKG